MFALGARTEVSEKLRHAIVRNQGRATLSGVSTPTDRFLLMVRQMGEEEGHARGWKAKVSRRLGLQTAHLSMLLGGRRSAGMTVVQKAIDRVGVTPAFFHDSLPGDPHYRDYLPGAVRDRPEALAAFLASPEGATADDDEVADLRAMRWRHEPTVLTYHFALQALRAQRELTRDEVALNAGLRAAVVAKGGQLRDADR